MRLSKDYIKRHLFFSFNLSLCTVYIHREFETDNKLRTQHYPCDK